MKNFWKWLVFLIYVFIVLSILIIFSRLLRDGLIQKDVLDFVFNVTNNLAWPLVTICLALFFKEQIGNLISRVKKFESPLGSIQTDERTVQSDPLEKKVPQTLGDGELTTKETEGLQRFLFFERTYNLIFGTQIEILKYFRKDRTGYLKPNLEKVYLDWQQEEDKPALKNYPFENYINYVLNNGLIFQEVIDGAISYKITEIGKDFLDYIEEQRYPNKNN